MNQPHMPQGTPPPFVARERGIPISAMLAGTGALVGGLYGLVGVIGGISGLYGGSFYRSVPTFSAQDKANMELKADIAELSDQAMYATSAVFLVMLGLGGLLLLLRRAAGLTMVIIGSGLALFTWVGVAAAGDSNHLVVLASTFALASSGLLIAAVLPATQRWIDEGRSAPIGPNRAGSGVAPYN